MWRLVLAAVVLLNFMGCGAADNTDKLLTEGFIRFQQQDYDGAIQNYERAIAKGAKSSGAYNMLGLSYRFKYQQTKIDELQTAEMVSFQKALQIDPKNWAAMINLGTTYYAMGEKAQATALFKKALALNPSHPEKAKIEKMMAEGTPKKH
jgi:tetratricopeptide (TPR) repeat protein